MGVKIEKKNRGNTENLRTIIGRTNKFEHSLLYLSASLFSLKCLLLCKLKHVCQIGVHHSLRNVSFLLHLSNFSVYSASLISRHSIQCSKESI